MQIDRIAEALASDDGTDLAAVDRALEALTRPSPVGSPRERAIHVLVKIAARNGYTESGSPRDVAAWLLESPERAPLAQLLLHVSSASLDEELECAVLLLIARRIGHRRRDPIAFADAQVLSLDRFLVDVWRRARAVSPHEWLYHPRRTSSIGSQIVRKFLADLITTSTSLRADAERGHVAADLNVEFAAGGREKTLDCVLGHPVEALGASVDVDNPLRKARLDEPIITFEVKACMTSHRQANSRLLDELHSSVEVVKARNRRAIPVAIVIVNVSPTFTNPLNLPGPNKHVAREVARIFERVVQRIKLDSGTGTDIAYGGLCLVVADIDNERRIREATREGRVPPTHTYERTIGRVAALYERRANSRS